MVGLLALALIACGGGELRGERGDVTGAGGAPEAGDPGDTGHQGDPGAPGDGDTGATDGQDSGATDGSDSGDTGDTGDTGALGCPPGMAGVPAADPSWCIDAYEAAVVEGEAVSQAGLVPVVGVTVVDAAALCEDSPVRDADGGILAERRLATLSEWQDAGDNQPGDGGDPFPWGDEWVEERCAAPTVDGEPTVAALQPAGSFPDCVSEAGVYDQVGNAFEWVDMGLVLDSEAFLAARAAEGLDLSLAEDGAVEVSSGAPGTLMLAIAGASGTLVADADGRVVVEDADLSGMPDTNWGYLQANASRPSAEARSDDFLPVGLSGDDVDAAGRPVVRHRPGEDGMPVPGKAGCAWYVGEADGCRLTMSTVGHTWDFGGTISFRCVSPLVPLEALPEAAD